MKMSVLLTKMSILLLFSFFKCIYIYIYTHVELYNKVVLQSVTMMSVLMQIEYGRKEMFYLMTHSTHFIYGYMASHIW